jgi:hypothetical protein
MWKLCGAQVQNIFLEKRKDEFLNFYFGAIFSTRDDEQRCGKWRMNLLNNNVYKTASGMKTGHTTGRATSEKR